MFIKTMKMHYQMIYGIFWMTNILLFLAAALFMKNYSAGFSMVYRTAPVVVGVFLAVNRLFGETDYEENAGLMQMLPIKKSTYISSKLVLIGLWTVFVIFLLAASIEISYRLVNFDQGDVIHVIILHFVSRGFPAEAGGAMIALSPIPVFLAVCFSCLVVAAVQMIGNWFGKRRRKAEGLAILTIIGFLLAGALLLGGCILTAGIVDAVPESWMILVLAGAVCVLAALDWLLFRRLVYGMEYRYEL